MDWWVLVEIQKWWAIMISRTAPILRKYGLGLGMGSQSLMGRQPTLVESLHLKAGILGSSPKLTCSSYVTLTQSLALYEPEWASSFTDFYCECQFYIKTICYRLGFKNIHDLLLKEYLKEIYRLAGKCRGACIHPFVLLEVFRGHMWEVLIWTIPLSLRLAIQGQGLANYSPQGGLPVSRWLSSEE